MSNEQKVLAYFEEFKGEGINPKNNASVQQSTYGIVVRHKGNQWMARWHDEEDEAGQRWGFVAKILGLDDQPAPVDKPEDFWKNYALQVRGENTELHKRLKEAEAAYTASLEALREQLSAPQQPDPAPFSLNVETGKLYAVFGLSRGRGETIYNACADVVLGKEQLFKIAKYIDRVWEIGGCSTEAERLYACYLFGVMFFGHSSTSMNAAQIDSKRLEFKEYGNKTDAAEYNDDHSYTSN